VISSGAVIWRVVHPEEALLLRVVSAPSHEDVISFVFSGIQDDCKVTVERMAYSKDRYKIKDRCHAFLLRLVNLWA
jgi:hypothetical protein